MAKNFDWNQYEEVAPQPVAKAAPTPSPTPSPASDFNWNEYESTDHAIAPPAYGAEVSSLESLARGAEQGATLGFGDEINGALEALLDSATGKNKNLSVLDAYRQHRDESRQAFKAAEDANPYVSGAGNLVGGLAPALLSGGATLPEQGLMAVAKTGAKYGAASGLGGSEVDLTKEGNRSDVAKDIALGGVVGGALAPVAQTVSNELAGPVGNLLGKMKNAGEALYDIPTVHNVATSFEQGAKYGRRLLGSKANKALNKELIDETRGVETNIQDALSRAGKEKMDTLTGEGDEIYMKDWYQSMLDSLRNLKNKYGQNEAVMDDLAKVQGLVGRHVFGDVEDAIPGKGLLFTAEDAENMLRQLGSLGSQGDASLKTNVGTEFVNRLVSPLKRDPNLIDRAANFPQGYSSLSELIANSRPATESGKGVAALNDELHALLKAKELIPSINDTANVEKNSLGGINATDRVDQFISALPESMRGKYAAKLRELAEAKTMADKIASPGLSHGIIADSARGTLYGGANYAGLATKAMYDMTPEALKQMSAKVISQGGEAAQKLGNIISQAADKDKIGRNALFFAMQQNPAYRELLRKVAGTDQPVK